MPSYTVRRAELADLSVLIRHRIRMFQDMAVMTTPDPNEEAMSDSFGAWLAEHMAAGTYVAWLVEARDEYGGVQLVSGGGATLIPWPPGPRSLRSRVAFVYNVFTEPEHRGRGLARQVMEAIHAFCRANDIDGVVLNASTFGQPLYESIGYRLTPSPMMFLALD